MTTTDGKPAALRHEVEAPKITDGLYAGFRNEATAVGIDPTDGLPRPAVTHPYQDAQAPELTPEALVCMADTRTFVRRDQWGHVVATFAPEVVQRTPNGTYLTPDPAKEGNFLVVLPVRPQCKHYARQYVPFPEELSHRLVVRLCTARRTDEGEFLDVGNAAVLACELRSPHVGCGVELIDAADAAIMAAQRAKKALEVADDFDLEKALENQ